MVAFWGVTRGGVCRLRGRACRASPGRIVRIGRGGQKQMFGRRSRLRVSPRFTFLGVVLVAGFMFGVMGASANHAPIPRHGISFQKSCQPTTPVGSLLLCGY